MGSVGRTPTMRRTSTSACVTKAGRDERVTFLVLAIARPIPCAWALRATADRCASVRWADGVHSVDFETRDVTRKKTTSVSMEVNASRLMNTW